MIQSAERWTTTVAAVLDELRPYLQADGGDVELIRVDVAKGCVYLELQGACKGCPSALTTVEMNIKVRLQEALPEVVQIITVTR